MKFLQRLGFRKADELDVNIALFSTRLSWAVMLVALWIWAVYDVVTKQTLTMPLTIFSLGVLVYFTTDLFMRRKMSSDRH